MPPRPFPRPPPSSQLLSNTTATTARPNSTAPSSTALGTAYEHRTRAFLSQPPLSLTGLLRVGGAGDRGIDLRGWWSAPALSTEVATRPGRPSPRQRHSVLVQCKAEKRRLGPNVVRELEGVVADETRASSSFTSSGSTSPSRSTMAFLVGLSGFSDEAYKRAMGSELPLGLVHLPFRFGQDAREGEEAVSLSLNMAMRRILGEEFELAVKRGLEDGRTGVVLRWSGEGLHGSKVTT